MASVDRFVRRHWWSRRKERVFDQVPQSNSPARGFLITERLAREIERKGANRSEEPCWDCGGAGCETCNDTGMLYTAEAIRDQLAVEEEPTNRRG